MEKFPFDTSEMDGLETDVMRIRAFEVVGLVAVQV